MNFIKTYNINHRKYRDVFQSSDGTIIYVDVEMPILFGNDKITAVVEWNIPMTEANKALVKQYGGQMDVAPYAEEGIGEFVFSGDNINDVLEKTGKFISDNRKFFIKK